MLIIAINGSPHTEGNTAMLLRESLKVIGEQGATTKLFQASRALATLKQPFCMHCSNPCSGSCYKGTLLEEMFSDLRRADGVLLGSPVYFGTISAQLKAFWDKTRILRKEKALLNVVGGALVNGATRFGGQESALRAIHEIMLTQGMIVAGSGYHSDDAGYQGACAQKPVSDDGDGLYRARVLGKRVLEVASATREIRLRN
ncbi:MAG TPA: flavodoxin family protein [Clostridia bacterium]|nr:flavodoxin family protein [Clostridia bacterium]